MKKGNFKRKFNYWLDEAMSKGTISIVRLLSFVVISAVIFVSLLIVLFKLRDSFFSAFWDSLATVINAWMPSSDEGDFGYVILNTMMAVIGLFFTSILIGVVGSGIEEKINQLRRGNSFVLENGHTVILGYNIGEHGLLNQLILAAGRQKRCIVILSDIEKPDLEQDIKNSIDIPDNVKVICRNGDITNVNDLRICSIDTAKLLIINALDDNRRIKTILAVSALKKEYPECNARIVACVTDEKHLLPRRKIKDKNMIIQKTDEIMAKVIAHTATEPGLSIVFKELMNFEENELYFETDYRLIGKSVLEISGILDHPALAGIKRGERIVLNPKRDEVIDISDEVILFEQEAGAYEVIEADEKNVEDRKIGEIEREDKGKVVVFGYNILLDTILSELHNDVRELCIISNDENVGSLIEEYSKLNITQMKTYRERQLEKIAEEADHIVVLTDREKDKEDADVDTILLLLKLMDIRERKDLSFNMVVELNKESSHNVSPRDDCIDYIVGSNIASLILAQMAENPYLENVFSELLTNRGNELYSKPIRNFNLKDEHDYSCAGLKEIILSYGYTLLGYTHEGKILMNPDLKQRVKFDMNDRLIVLGRD